MMKEYTRKVRELETMEELTEILYMKKAPETIDELDNIFEELYISCCTSLIPQTLEPSIEFIRLRGLEPVTYVIPVTMNDLLKLKRKS